MFISNPFREVNFQMEYLTEKVILVFWISGHMWTGCKCRYELSDICDSNHSQSNKVSRAFWV